KNGMGTVLESENHFAAATKLYEEAVALYVELSGPEAPAVANTTFNLANGAVGAEQWDKAEASYRKAIDLAAKIYPDSNYNIEIFRVAYGMMLNKRHRFGEAKTVFARVLAHAERDPSFRDDEVYRVAEFCTALAEYGLEPTAPHAAAFARLATPPAGASP